MFKESKDLLDGLSEAERQWQKFIASMGDWDSVEDVKAYRFVLRESAREQILLSLVGEERICPACGDIVPENRRWVLNQSKTVAVCRSCWFTAKGIREEKHEDVHLFVVPARRFGINGFQLRKCREIAMISRRRFANQCGWTVTHQWKLEAGEYKSVGYETADTILQVLKLNGLTTLDDLISEPEAEDDNP